MEDTPFELDFVGDGIERRYRRMRPAWRSSGGILPRLDAATNRLQLTTEGLC